MQDPDSGPRCRNLEQDLDAGQPNPDAVDPDAACRRLLLWTAHTPDSAIHCRTTVGPPPRCLTLGLAVSDPTWLCGAGYNQHHIHNQHHIYYNINSETGEACAAPNYLLRKVEDKSERWKTKAKGDKSERWKFEKF